MKIAMKKILKKLCLLCVMFFSLLCAAEELPEVIKEELSNNSVLKLQIALDNLNFSPNCIDGVWGHKTAVAFATWCELQKFQSLSNGMARIDEALASGKLKLPQEYFIKIIIPENATNELTQISSAPEEKAKLEKLNYSTLLEKYAELGHCTEGALKRWNPSLAWPNPNANSEVWIPNVGEGNGNEKQRTAASLRIVLKRFEITVFDSDGQLIGLFPCSIADDKSKLPPCGEVQVTTVIHNPNYTYRSQYKTQGGAFIFSPGPNSPVGVRWMGLSLPGYGIHGTPYPETIGKAESKGCFRLSNWNAVKLCNMVESGLPVVIE